MLLPLLFLLLAVTSAEEALLIYSDGLDYDGHRGDRGTTSLFCRGLADFSTLDCSDAVMLVSYTDDDVMSLGVNQTQGIYGFVSRMPQRRAANPVG